MWEKRGLRLEVCSVCSSKNDGSSFGGVVFFRRGLIVRACLVNCGLRNRTILFFIHASKTVDFSKVMSYFYAIRGSGIARVLGGGGISGLSFVY